MLLKKFLICTWTWAIWSMHLIHKEHIWYFYGKTWHWFHCSKYVSYIYIHGIWQAPFLHYQTSHLSCILVEAPCWLQIIYIIPEIWRRTWELKDSRAYKPDLFALPHFSTGTRGWRAVELPVIISVVGFIYFGNCRWTLCGSMCTLCPICCPWWKNFIPQSFDKSLLE